MSEYPTRPSHYAHRVVRQLFKTCAAMEIGETATLLVIFVAHTEDAKRYSAPPNFFNDQLIPILGIRKWETLDRARRAAVKAGWLHYEEPPSGTRKPGVYWTMIPERFADIDDAPIGETPYPPNGYGRGDGSQEAYPPNGYGRGDGCGYGCGYGRGDGMGEHPTLYPTPSPKKTATPKNEKPKFQPPNLEEIRHYCKSERLIIEPDGFHDYYTAQGWKLTNGQPMKDWKAAARNWDRNERKRQPVTGGPIESDYKDYA